MSKKPPEKLKKSSTSFITGPNISLPPNPIAAIPKLSPKSIQSSFTIEDMVDFRRERGIATGAAGVNDSPNKTTLTMVLKISPLPPPPAYAGCGTATNENEIVKTRRMARILFLFFIILERIIASEAVCCTGGMLEGQE